MRDFSIITSGNVDIVRLTSAYGRLGAVSFRGEAIFSVNMHNVVSGSIFGSGFEYFVCYVNTAVFREVDDKESVLELVVNPVYHLFEASGIASADAAVMNFPTDSNAFVDNEDEIHSIGEVRAMIIEGIEWLY